MNKYLDLAERVLTKTRGMLSARQIWNMAEEMGMTRDKNYGKAPWITLGRLLSSEVKHHTLSTAFATTTGVPRYYFLRCFEDDGWDKIVSDLDYRASDLEKVDASLLLRRIRTRNPIPTPYVVEVKLYERDANLIAYVRLRAGHCCELCGKKGFLKQDGSYYIEVHHIKRLADGGEDTPENAAAVCADCHRRLHHSAEKEELLTKLLAIRHEDA